MVGGVLYTTAGFRPNVVAIDAATGETLWTYRLDEGAARRSRAAQRVARRRVLDRRQTGADHPGDARLSARVARREDRPARSGVRQERRRRSVSGFRSAPARRRRHQLDIAGGRREERDRVRRGNGRWNGAALEGKHQGIHPRLRRPLRKTAVDVPHDSAARRVRQRHVAERLVVVHRATRRCGPPSPRTKSSATCTCPSNRRPATSTAAIDPATTCSRAASCAWMPEPANASGTSNSCITTSGITTSRRRRT